MLVSFSRTFALPDGVANFSNIRARVRIAKTKIPARIYTDKGFLLGLFGITQLTPEGSFTVWVADGLEYAVELFDVNTGFVYSTQQSVDPGGVGGGGTGQDGKSAYEVAVDAGFNGTVDEWLTSLQGQSFNVDTSGLRADRDDYDTEAEGYSYLATDEGMLYIRLGVVSGVWSTGIEFGRGAKGDTGNQGPQGIQGVPGTPGVPGAPGIDGTNGTNGKTILSGSTTPGGGLGTDGDFYIRTSNWTFYGPKSTGNWGSPTSLIGPQGIQGNQGLQGIQGIQGTPGENGANGNDAYQVAVANGFSGNQTQWLASLKGADGAPGTPGEPGEPGAPGTSFTVQATGLFSTRSTYDTEDEGFSFLATDTGNLYIRQTATPGTWSAAIPFGKGEQGEQGPQGVQGNPGTPGTNGTDGRTIHSGSTAPGNGLGANGDFYIRTSDWTIYGPKAGGTWPAATSLVGPQGTQGVQGIQGNQGNPGNPGADGDDGAPGANGLHGISVIITNPAMLLPADAAGVVSSYANSGFSVQVFEGSTALAASASATVAAFRIGTLTQAPGGTLTPGGVSYAGELATVAAHSAMQNGVPGVVITIPITIYRTNGALVTTTRTQVVAKAVRGAQGIQGDTGATGNTGTAGAAGKTVLSGAAAPGGGLGVDGDFYIRTSDWTIYGPKATTWPSPVSIIGPQGTQGIQGEPGTPGTAGTNGQTVLSGTAAPGGGLGANGDFYIRTSDWTIYGPKAGGAWGSPTSLVGAQGTAGTAGAAGKTVLSGAGAASGGVDGDFYIRTSDWTISGPKAGTWPAAVSLVGPQGTQGVQGNPGTTGNTGAAGLDGLSIVINNPVMLLPASNAGVVSSYTGSGLTVQVFEGGTALTASASATTSAFRIGTITQSPTTTITIGGVSYATNTATVAAHSAMQNGTNQVVLTIPITIYRANGTSITVNRTQVISKAVQGAQGIQGNTGNTGNTGTTGATGPMSPKAILLPDPTNAEKIVLFKNLNAVFTLTEIASLLPGGSATPSVTFSIRYGTDVSGAGTEVVVGGITVTSTTTGLSTTALTNANIPANNWVWLTTTAKSGTVPALQVTLRG